VTLQVVTGFSALGQAHEAQAIIEWLKELLEIFGEQTLSMEVKFSEVALRTGTSQGITDVQGMLFTDQEKAANQQSAMNANATQAVAPELAKGAMGLMQKNPEAAAQVAENMNPNGQ